MLTNRENRPALAVTLAAHALQMGLLAILVAFAPVSGVIGACIAMTVLLLYLLIVIGGIAWLADIAAVRRLCDSSSQFAQAFGGTLFIVGLVGVTIGVTASWLYVSGWSYAGFALLSGAGAARQYRLCAVEALTAPPVTLPVARLVR